MRIYTVFVGLICTTLFSCGPLAKMTLGIEAPEYKTDSEVIDYANKNLRKDLKILRVNNFDADSKFPMNTNTLPSVKYIYKGEDKMLNQTCTEDYKKLILAPIDSLNSLEVIDSFKDDQLNQDLYGLNSDELIDSSRPTFLIFYASYAGFLNRKNILPWIEALEQRSDVKYVLINCDISIPLKPGEKNDNRVKFEK